VENYIDRAIRVDDWDVGKAILPARACATAFDQSKVEHGHRNSRVEREIHGRGARGNPTKSVVEPYIGPVLTATWHSRRLRVWLITLRVRVPSRVMAAATR